MVLFNDTIEHNLRYGDMEASEEDVLDAVRTSRFETSLNRMPLGLLTPVGERGLKLSGGEKQRVAIARAMLKKAPILLCDEMSANLDLRTEHQIMDSLLSVGDECTMVYIAHRLASIRNSDKIIVLDKGKVVAQGTHEELMQDMQGLYYGLWVQQLLED